MQPIAIVPFDVPATAKELALVASAIQIQLVRDVGPIWSTQASCTAFPELVDVPVGYAIVFVVADAKGRSGLHFRPKFPDEPPFALVQYQSHLTWSVAASHEVIEMLIDPLGKRLTSGMHPLGDPEKVEFLMEVCDPCQDVQFAYQVDHQHAILVSDFCTPAFYGMAPTTGSYSFRRSVAAPFSVARGGYLSYKNNKGEWFQLRAFGGPTGQVGPLAESDVIGEASDEPGNLRGAFDRAHHPDKGDVWQRSAVRSGSRYSTIRKRAERLQAARDTTLNDFLSVLRS